MGDRFNRMMRVQEKMHFIMNAPTFVLATLPEVFFRGVLDDLHKLSYSFLDEKRWMEAGDYLTQAIIVLDCIKKAGFQKTGDSSKEENTFLLRAACGLKLGAYDVSQTDATLVLKGDPDNRYAQEIRLLAECEIALMQYANNKAFVRPKLEKLREDINKLKTKKSFQWDQAHFEKTIKRLDDILGPKGQQQAPKMSWASMVNNRPPRPAAAPQQPPTDPKKVDEGWIPKQSLPKQPQQQKQQKQKKKSRSRRQNRPRREVDVTFGEFDDEEDDEDETESESDVENGLSPKASDFAGLDDIGVTAPMLKTEKMKMKVAGLDEIEDFGYKTPQRKHEPPRKETKAAKVPQVNGHQRSAMVNGAVPKTNVQVPPPQPLNIPKLPPQPNISAGTRQWLAGHEFRLACHTCYTQVPNKFGIYAYRYNQDPNHKPKCPGGMLVCRLAYIPPRNGVRDVYGRIRPRTKPDFKGRYTLCQQFQNGLPCKISAESCWFPHSNEEMEVWEADRNGHFQGKEIIAYLRYKLTLEVIETMKNKHALSQAKTSKKQNAAPNAAHPPGAFPKTQNGPKTQQAPGGYPFNQTNQSTPQRSTQPPGAYPGKTPSPNAAQKAAQPPGAYPHNTSPKTNGFQQPPAVVRTAPPLLPTPSRAPPPLIPAQAPTTLMSPPPQSQAKATPLADSMAHTKIMNLIRNVGGQFLFLCRFCFDGAPQVLSVQNSSHPGKCTGEESHTWNTSTRCLVHRLCENGRDRYWKIRKRPNGIPPKAFLCWHRNKSYGCPIGTKCHFAHNEMEICIWLFEAYQPLDRELCVRLSFELTYGPTVPTPTPQVSHGAAKAQAFKPEPPVQQVKVQQPSRPVFQYKIKVVCGLCYTKTKKPFEQNPRKPTQCVNGHVWGQNSYYYLDSSSQGRWIRIQSRHHRLRPEIEPVLCRRMNSCQYKETFSSQCMFPHSEEERLLWIYQIKAKAKTIEEVIEIQRRATAAANKTSAHQPGPGGDASAAASAAASSAPSHVPAQMKTSHFLCSYCDMPFRTKQLYDRHVSSMEHKMRIKSDTERSWKYRSPPLNVTNGDYKLCQNNVKKTCNYTGVAQERNDCPLAHSQEELEEWRERHEYRLMKIAKAKEQRLYSFVDELLAEYNQKSNAEYEVMTEEIPGITARCLQNLKAILPVKDRTHEQDMTFEWEFEVTSARKSLRRVGLLYDEHRLHFHLSEPANEDRPQVCPGGMIAELGGTSYKIKIQFHTHILGLFHQWVVFDFGEKPVLVRKISAHIGSSTELERFAKQQQTREKIKLWDSGNSQIVKFSSPSCQPDFHVWEKQLIAHYKQPSTLSGLEDEEADMRMNTENYKLHMHRMLNLEELECMERLARYSTATEMFIVDKVEQAYPFPQMMRAQNGELFGRLKLEIPLYDDSEASQIVQLKVQRVYLKFNQESDVVYEALLLKNSFSESQTADIVCVQLSSYCVKEQNLTSFLDFSGDPEKAKAVHVIVQFQLDRLQFVYQHHAVDNLNCMTVIFPPHRQQDRFDYVHWDEVRNRQVAMNPRQEKAARYISNAGGLQGNHYFRGKGPVIIFGPFGTGKTYTMANAIIRTLLVRNDSRILICTRSNSAADMYITEYLDQFCRDFPGLVCMVRMYAVLRQKAAISDVVMKYVLKHPNGNLRHPYDEELADWARYAKTQSDDGRRTPNIVIATLSTAVHLTRDQSLKEYFTHIIIDEAGQVLETEAIIPLQLATNDTCVVLAGDHKQISPKVYSGRARKAQFEVSMLKRLFSYSQEHKCKYDLLLTYNYRTCREILDFLAQSYYGTHLEAQGRHPPHPFFYPLNFFVVKGEDRLVGTSYVNNEEMLEVAFRVEDLYRNWPQEWGSRDEEAIAVLTPYTLQCHLIRKELKRRGLHSIAVDTVQNVQGKQFRAVIISAVRTRQTLNKAHITAIPQATGTQQENEFYYAFLSDERLLNTAFTRAKSMIFVIGDPVALCSVGSCQMTWVRFVQECEKNKSIVPPDMTVEMIQQEIAAAKQRLNPTAVTYNPRRTGQSQQRGAASPPKSATPAAKPWVSGNSIWNKSARMTQKGGASSLNPAYQRLNSDEFPELPDVAQVVQNRDGTTSNHLSESDDEDEFEEDFVTEIQDDDLLKELRHQVKVDFHEEMQESSDYNSSTEEDVVDDFDTEVESHVPPPQVVRRGEPLPDAQQESPVRQVPKDSVFVTPEPKKEAKKLDKEEPKPVPPPVVQPPLEPRPLPQEPTLDLQNNDVPQFRMVEREGRIALLPRHMPRRGLSQVEDYDSDEDEAHGASEEQTEDDFLEKTLMEPEKYRVCIFRYDLKGLTYAIPVDRTTTEVISITSKKRRGQALDNDEVVVEIIDNVERPEELEGVSESVKEEEESRIYGQVIHVLKRDIDPYLRKLVCTLDPFSDNLMQPIDKTFPKLFITKSEDKSEESRDKNVAKVTIHTISREAAKTQGRYTPERNVYITNKERPHKLFVVRFWKWYPKTPYPMGVVVEELEPGDTPRQGLHILKLVHNVKDKFKVTVDEYLQQNFPLGWSIPNAEEARRIDFRDRKIFTIDPQDSEDLDDAVSLRTVGNNFEVGIHIADVSYFVPKGSDLDEEARFRATSFYPTFHEKPIHMLPKRLSSDLCSLLPDRDRLALSLMVVVNADGQLAQAPNVFRTIIRSRHKLSYSQAEQIIQGDCPEGLDNVAEPIRQMHKLAAKKRAIRLGDKAHIFNAEDDDGDVQDPLAHSLIEEFMILANEIIADHLLMRYADCTPLRRQLAPLPEKLEEWKKNYKDGVRNSIWLTAAVGDDQEEDVDEDDGEPTLPLTKAVWEEIVQAANDDSLRSLEKLSNLICIDQNHPLQAVALAQFHRTMERSEYVNSGDHPEPEKKSHYSLQLKAYTHYTSPIRRFIDLVVHRLLIASLENAPCPYDANELANITHHCSGRALHANRFSKESQSLQLALKLKEAPLQLMSFVENLSDSSMKLLFPHRSYIPPRQTNMRFNILKPIKVPETSAASVSVDLTWKTRIYDVRKNGNQRHGIRKDAIQLDTKRHTVQVPEDNWEDIQRSVKRGDFKDIKRAINSAIEAGGSELTQFNDVMRQFSEKPSVEVDCEYVDRLEKQQVFINFCRSYKRGDVNLVQMHASLSKGVLTPHIQLFSMTSHLDICAEHRENPVLCLSDVATKIPGKEKNIKAYQNTWLPILSMISAYGAVMSDETLTIHNISITWQKLEGGKFQGYFNIPYQFSEQRNLRLVMQGRSKDKQHDEVEDDYHLDFLCIRYKNLPIHGRKLLKMRDLDNRSKSKETIGPYNRRAWEIQTFVAHGYTTSVQNDDKAQLKTVTFQLHTTSLPFPEEQLLYQHESKQKTCTIEILPASKPDRRLEAAVRNLPNSTPLIRHICLHKPCKPNDGVFSTDEITKVALREGAKVRDLRVKDTDLHPLNRSQQDAVRMALKNNFSVIQGPPGTGKTVTGAYLAYFFTQINQHIPATGKGTPQVLYCGPSNKAVDVIASYLKKFKMSVVRVYSEMMETKKYPIPGMPSFYSKWKRSNEAKIDERLDDISLHALIRREGTYAEDIRAKELEFKGMETVSPAQIKKYKKLISMAEKEELKKHSIVLCTCNAAGADRIASTNIIQCIIDEAGMCNEPETLIPLTTTLPHQIVLIGDHKQLRPIITEPNARDLGMEQSLLEKYKRKANMLTIQYRMHEAICSFPSENFYEGKLETDKSVKIRSVDPLRAVWPNRGQTPTVWCHVYGKEESLTVKADEGNEMSKANMAEVMHATRIVQQLLRKGAKASDIVVLSQYKLQCAYIQERLKVMGHMAVKVSTVVTSQGSEWDYVVLSTVRSKPQVEIDDKPSHGWRRKHLGFITDENQMNVALTRAKRGLVIIGNRHLLETHPKWKELIKKYDDQGCVMDARHFPPFGH